jgi:uncharacterized protein (UPF0332 family)
VTVRFARALVRKSERALRSARLNLAENDYDAAVNRSYYAMFDIARAALLRAGVAEDKLPRTHNGVIDAFRQHAARSGQIDRELAADLSRAQSHRVKADYTGIEIDPKTASETVVKAEAFVQTVGRVFALDEAALAAAEQEERKRGRDDTVFEPEANPRAPSPEETRRQARENWLRLRQQTAQRDKSRDAESQRGVEDDRGLSVDTESDD